MAKGRPPKNTSIKERAIHSISGLGCRRELMKSVYDDVSENQLSQSQIHVTAIWVLTVKCKKARLNR
jgi:hypothetical protein